MGAQLPGSLRAATCIFRSYSENELTLSTRPLSPQERHDRCIMHRYSHAARVLHAGCKRHGRLTWLPATLSRTPWDLEATQEW